MHFQRHDVSLVQNLTVRLLHTVYDLLFCVYSVYASVAQRSAVLNVQPE